MIHSLYRKQYPFLKAFVIVFFIIICSCKSLDKIEIGDIQDVKINGIAGQTVFLEFSAPIKNNSGMNIKITGVNLDVKVDDVYIGKVNNLEIIKIGKKTQEVYTFKLKLKIAGLFGVFNVMKVFKADTGMLNLTGDIKVKIMGMNKKIEVNEIQEINFAEFKNKLP